MSDANANASNFPVLTSSCSGKCFFFMSCLFLEKGGGGETQYFILKFCSKQKNNNYDT